MVTQQEIQDEKYRKMGFYLDRDYEYPKLQDIDYKLLQNVRDRAKEIDNKTEFLKTLENASVTYEIIRIYHLYKSEFKEFVDSLENKGDLPDDILFDKLDKIAFFEGVVDFIIHDGGETRQDKAYHEDGNTVKEGFVRFYFK